MKGSEKENMARILLAEPDEDYRKALTEQLRAMGHEILVASTIQECLKKLRGEEKDILVLSLEMPGIKGEDMVSIVRSIEPDLDIIVATENNCPRLEKAVRKTRIFYYHLKSFGIEELFMAIENALNRGGKKIDEGLGS